MTPSLPPLSLCEYSSVLNRQQGHKLSHTHVYLHTNTFLLELILKKNSYRIINSFYLQPVGSESEIVMQYKCQADVWRSDAEIHLDVIVWSSGPHETEYR